MKSLFRTSLVLLPLVLALVVGEAAHAHSPDAARTPTATPTARPTPTPTPWVPLPVLPPERVAKFHGEVWLEGFGGYDHAGIVTARIGDTICGVPSCANEGHCLRIPIDPMPISTTYAIDVLPFAARVGCAYEGALVKFFVGEQQSDVTAVWHAGTVQEVNLTAGPPFAFFQGEFTLAFQTAEPIGVRYPAGMTAVIAGNVCGKAARGIWKERDSQGRDVYRYYVPVYSNEQQQGCGVEGAEVTFNLIWRGAEGDVHDGSVVATAREKGVWHAWGDGNTGQELNLTMDPVGAIKVANVGDGSSQRRDDALWMASAIGLSILGSLGIVAAVVLRRRAAG